MPLVAPGTSWQEKLAAALFRDPTWDPDWPEGVEVLDFEWVPKEDLYIHPQSRQPRHAGTNLAHLRSTGAYTRARAERLGQKYAWKNETFYHTEDANRKRKTLESGHHKLEEALGIEVITILPSLRLRFSARGDGLDARDQFLEWANNHPPALNHSANEAIAYLNKLEDQGYFKAATLEKDEKKRITAIRKVANAELTKYYGSYTPQKRGAMVTKWLGGINPQKMETLSSKKVWDLMVGIGWFSVAATKSGAAYHPAINRIETVTQSHTADLTLGSVTRLVREQIGTWRGDGLTELAIKNKLDKLDIAVAMHVSGDRLTSVENLAGLNVKRQEFLQNLEEINNDTLLNRLRYTTVYIMPQCLQPSKERVPVAYRWDSNSRKFIKQL